MIRVFFDIRGFSGSPEQITKIIGVKPDEAWCEGDVIPSDLNIKAISKEGFIRKRKFSVWKLIASQADSLEIDRYIDSIVRRIIPIKERIKNLPEDCELTMYVWVDIYPELPISINMKQQTVDFLKELDIDIDMDVSFKSKPKI